MAYPASLILVTVTGTLIDTPDGAPVTGEVRFRSNVLLISTASIQSVVPVDVTVQLDATGSFSIALPANDDADWTPTGWSYSVRVAANGKLLYGTIALPSSPGTVDLFDSWTLGDTGSSGGSGGSSGPVAWTAITGKPSTFPPSAHVHALSDVTGLTSALAGKAASVHAHAESDVTGLTADLAALDGRLDVLEAGGGGGGAPATGVVRATITGGDVPAPSDASWAPLSGLTISLPATAGDDVELYVGCLLDANGAATDAYEMCVIASGGGVARFGSTNTSSPNAAGPGEGDPAAYPHPAGQRFQPFSAIMSFTVAAGDLTAGNVVFGIAHKGPGGGKVFASAAYPFRWRARNDH